MTSVFAFGQRGAEMPFLGVFVGTFSPLAHAALCKAAPRTGPVRCGFAVESSVKVGLHGACPMHCALLSGAASYRGVVAISFGTTAG